MIIIFFLDFTNPPPPKLKIKSDRKKFSPFFIEQGPCCFYNMRRHGNTIRSTNQSANRKKLYFARMTMNWNNGNKSSIANTLRIPLKCSSIS